MAEEAEHRFLRQQLWNWMRRRRAKRVVAEKISEWGRAASRSAWLQWQGAMEQERQSNEAMRRALAVSLEEKGSSGKPWWDPSQVHCAHGWAVVGTDHKSLERPTCYKPECVQGAKQWFQ